MRNDRGAVAVLVAASLLMLFGIAAYAVDLSAVRLDRAADQRITDAAASAGALANFEGTAVEGCEDALAYVAINTAGITTLDDSECSVEFGTACSAGDARELTEPSGRWSITVVNPVPDNHRLMTPGQLGAASHGAAGDDGDPCDRFGVEMLAVHTNNFGQVMGFTEGSTTVHSVALAELPPPDGVPINLLLLDRHERCGLQTEGTEDAGIIVKAVYNPEDDVIEPGVAAIDSDGTIDTCGKGVINIQGNSILRADGPAPCPNEEPPSTPHPLAPHLLVGKGCGLIQPFADVVPPPDTCVGTVACTASGGINPNNPNPLPTKLRDRITRAPVDHRYNCWPNYTSLPAGVAWATDALTTGNEQNIDGCSEGGSPAIYNLIQEIGPPGSPPLAGGYQTWPTDSPHNSCTVDPGDGPISVSGKWWIDCPVFDVKDRVVFNDGDVVFEGDVNVTSSTGDLAIINGDADPHIAFLRDGVFNKDSHAHLTLVNVSMYASKLSSVTMSGGGGTLDWRAPNLDGYEFDDLALWSDSAATHEWAGQSTLTMSGVFFTPLALADYSGTSGQNHTDAQFIADKLVARGQGKLEVAPIFGHAVGIRPPPVTVLLR